MTHSRLPMLHSRVLVVVSWKDVLMSGMTMCVGGLEVEEYGVTRQLVGRKAA